MILSLPISLLFLVHVVNGALRDDCLNYNKQSWYDLSSSLCYTFDPDVRVTVTTSTKPGVDYCALDLTGTYFMIKLSFPVMILKFNRCCGSGRPKNGRLAIVPSRLLRNKLIINDKVMIALTRTKWTSQDEPENSTYAWFSNTQNWTASYIEFNTNEPTNRVEEVIGYMNGYDNNRFHDMGNVDWLGVLCEFGKETYF